MGRSSSRTGFLAVAGLAAFMTLSIAARTSVLAEGIAPKASGEADATVQKGADASDPEPDAVVVPATPSPSHDPLDRVKPASANPTQADPSNATSAAEAPLPPLNAAIKAALSAHHADPAKAPKTAEKAKTENAKEEEAIASFYTAHGFSPAWSDNGKPVDAVPSILARLAAAKEDGLALPATPTALNTTGSPQEIAESDLALTQAVVAYARQATGARIEPRSISPLVGAKPDLADPAQVLDTLKTAGEEAGAKLRALNPSDPRYIALRDKLAELRSASAPKDEDRVIEPGPFIKIGMRDQRVPLIRSRLGLEAKARNDDAATLYDPALAAAVLKYQRAHGLQATGVIGDPTIVALNGGNVAMPQPRLEAMIIANMEMWRWVPHDLGVDRVEVNIPDYAVKVYHDNKLVATNRVVVGKTDTPTPIFSNTMTYLTVNPAWNVPQSIIKKEFGGGAARGFIARYVHGQLFLQQPPGPGNALGRITFMFPNEYAVYLHDTPAKGLFGTPRRAYSHGCVRVDKPFDLAQSILNDGVPDDGKPQWSVKRLQAMLGMTERRVDLPKPLPIHIVYFTASVDESGKVATREDIYGYSAAVGRALGLGAIGSAPLAGSAATLAGHGPAARRHGTDSASAGHKRRRHYADSDPDRPRRHSRRSSGRYAEDGAPQAQAAEAQPAPTSRGFGFLPF